ncbi:hypothetical protein HDV01_005624 [Terramyces sp. JEL0728]|nr:hypothetical protein HDV01_005624 [Terramyces sp. JEL0728]
MSAIQDNLALLKQNVKELGIKYNRDITLVAMSKTKPIESIKECYTTGHLDFGENYVRLFLILIQELVEKSESLPADIKWHFCGSIQTNKLKTLSKIPNLFVIETIESEKQAVMLNKHLERRMNIFIQVNTSNEENKSGIKPSGLETLVDQVLLLPNINLMGLMTIGSFDNSHNEGNNPDFEVLLDCKTKIEEKYGLSLQVSMGMSDDYEQAIHQGSTNVRVGSKVFGPRIYKK